MKGVTWLGRSTLYGWTVSHLHRVLQRKLTLHSMLYRDENVQITFQRGRNVGPWERYVFPLHNRPVRRGTRRHEDAGEEEIRN